MSKKKKSEKDNITEVDDVLIENKDSHTDNDDFAKIEDAMKKFIDKKAGNV